MRKKLAVLAVVVGLLGSGIGSAAASPPNFAAAQHLCEAQGGALSLAGGAYECGGLTNLEPSSRQFATARRVCERVYAGQFGTSAGNFYSCFDVY